MESVWALTCTKYLVGGFDKIFEDNLSSIYSVMDLATFFLFLEQWRSVCNETLLYGSDVK